MKADGIAKVPLPYNTFLGMATLMRGTLFPFASFYGKTRFRAPESLSLAPKNPGLLLEDEKAPLY